MSIILRTLKGSALTYEEMDRNLSQYFYSSSVHEQGTKLRLHFTGSDSLDTATEDYGATPSQSTRYHEITVNGGEGNNNIPGVTKIIAGDNITIDPASGIGNVTINSTAAGEGANPGGTISGAVQYRVNSTTFGGDDSYFYYDSSNNYLSLGTTSPERVLHITSDRSRPAFIRLQTDGSPTNSATSTEIFHGTERLGDIGKHYSGDNRDLYIHSNYYNSTTRQYNKIHFAVGRYGNAAGQNERATVTTTGLGIQTTNPNRELTVITNERNLGIGIGQDTEKYQSVLRPIPKVVYQRLFGNLNFENSSGLIIHPSEKILKEGTLF